MRKRIFTLLTNVNKVQVINSNTSPSPSFYHFVFFFLHFIATILYHPSRNKFFFFKRSVIVIKQNKINFDLDNTHLHPEQTSIELKIFGRNNLNKRNTEFNCSTTKLVEPTMYSARMFLYSILHTMAFLDNFCG